jgi:hypothetical protein
MERIASENIVKLPGENYVLWHEQFETIALQYGEAERTWKIESRMNQVDLLQMMKFTIVCPGNIETRCSCGAMIREKGPMWYANGNIGWRHECVS